MAKSKRVTRKQLLKEPDEFISTTGRVIRWARAHRKPIQYTVYGLAAVLLAVVAIQYVMDLRTAKAFAMLDKAVSEYETAKNSDGEQQAYERVKDDFQKIIDAYAGNPGGKLARFTFANICYAAGAFDPAISHFTLSKKDFDGDAFYQRLITSGIGRAQAEKKDREAAVRTFTEIAEQPADYLKDEALFFLGTLYEDLGQSDKSKTAFGRLVSEFPTSMYVNMINER